MWMNHGTCELQRPASLRILLVTLPVSLHSWLVKFVEVLYLLLLSLLPRPLSIHTHLTRFSYDHLVSLSYHIIIIVTPSFNYDRYETVIITIITMIPIMWVNMHQLNTCYRGMPSSTLDKAEFLGRFAFLPRLVFLGRFASFRLFVPRPDFFCRDLFSCYCKLNSSCMYTCSYFCIARVELQNWLTRSAESWHTTIVVLACQS